MRKLIALALAVCLVACGDKKEPPKTVEIPPESTASAASALVTPIPTGAEMLSAMKRGFDRTNQICINTIDNKTSFFIDFKEDPDPTKFSGWYYIEKISFYRTQANTWYVQDIPDDQFIKVYPDVTGLQCKVG